MVKPIIGRLQSTVSHGKRLAMTEYLLLKVCNAEAWLAIHFAVNTSHTNHQNLPLNVQP